MYIYNQTINQSIKIMYAPNASIESIQFAYHTHYTTPTPTHLQYMYLYIMLYKYPNQISISIRIQLLKQSINQSNQNKPNQTTKLNLKYITHI